MKTNPEQLLKDKNIKVTANRILILDVFLNHPYSLSLSDIEEALPWADRATIFRTLKTFEEKAMIHVIKDTGRAVKYALCSESCDVDHHMVHPHFHCDVCGETTCLTGYKIPKVNLPENYKAHQYSLVINGVCAKCN